MCASTGARLMTTSGSILARGFSTQVLKSGLSLSIRPTGTLANLISCPVPEARGDPPMMRKIHFITFVSLVISSYVRHIWKTTTLKDAFSSSLEVLDVMRSIRCIEHRGKARFITPFTGDQVGICNAFGFNIPEGCAPTYMSKKKAERKRGRPRKTTDVVKLD